MYPLFFQQIKSNFRMGWIPWSQIPATKHHVVAWHKCPGVAHSIAIACPPSVPLQGSISGRAEEVRRSLSRHDTNKIINPWKPINFQKLLKNSIFKIKLPLRTWPKCSLLVPHRISSSFTWGSRLVVPDPIALKGEGTLSVDGSDLLLCNHAVGTQNISSFY